EPMPVDKSPGDSVTGATLNASGTFVMRAERVGSDTLLAQITHMVGQAQRSRAPIQRLADRVAGWFVPAVIAVAAVTFVAWLWLVDVRPLGGYRDAEVLRLAASVELGSEHPLAQAIVDGARERGIEPAAASSFRAMAGQGVTANVEGRAVAVGNASFLGDRGV